MLTHDTSVVRCGLAAVLCTLLAAACASSSANLDPAAVPEDEGAVVGHVTVTNKQRDVTRECTAVFSSTPSRVRTNVQLDPDGWVLTTLPRGAARIEAVSCTLDRMTKFRVDDANFVVPGKGAVAYFGHLTVDLKADGPSQGSVIAAGLLAGGVGAALAAEEGESGFQRGSMKLDSQIDYAKRVYLARYGDGARIVNSMQYSRRSKLSDRLAQRPDVELAETNLDGLKLILFGVPSLHPDRVMVRFEHLVRKAQLRNCSTFALTLDDHSATYDVQQHDKGESVIEESAQGQLDFDVVRALAAANRVELDLCGLTRTLDRSARHATQEFVRRFQLRAQRR